MKHLSGRSKHTTLLDETLTLIKLIDKIANQPKINIGPISRKSPRSKFILINQKGNLVACKIGTDTGIQELVVSLDDNIQENLSKLAKTINKHKIFRKYRLVIK